MENAGIKIYRRLVAVDQVLEYAVKALKCCESRWMKIFSLHHPSFFKQSDWC